MSPFVSSVTDLFSGDLATVSAEIHNLRAALLTSDVQVTWEEAEGLAPGRSSPGMWRPAATTAPGTGCGVWPPSTTPGSRSGRVSWTSWMSWTACPPRPSPDCRLTFEAPPRPQ